MSKFNTKDITVDSIQKIRNLANKKKLCKTMFKFSPQAQKIINRLTGDKLRIHDLFDMMATHMTKESGNPDLALNTNIETTNDDRKSYTISEDSKAVFSGLAKKMGVTRDILVENALYLLLRDVQSTCIGVDEKLRRARRLREKVCEIENILNSTEFNEDVEVLLNCGDADFNGDDIGYCSQELEYVNRAVDLLLALDKYIERKQIERTHEKD